MPDKKQKEKRRLGSMCKLQSHAPNGLLSPSSCQFLNFPEPSTPAPLSWGPTFNIGAHGNILHIQAITQKKVSVSLTRGS